ncbi:hypothetical protein ASPZODRAFT_77483 [Penicilliopsis zonata CBS 506.65]|uniref:Cytochrome P450 n=1 Tax=Penicilliopsis zonata CBS 506.65 TaxID=1073090 RepID=A0A1L9S4W7_9EURO|nr:hypothetical protein ASPZODRAFT_77483 [Penicilliopsis zonata CBS 506.65]OJJ42191.1 hypothetical protein ASPZODRAFT_77483 [Penicilliopsis zonata CBS 506.65]
MAAWIIIVGCVFHAVLWKSTRWPTLLSIPLTLFVLLVWKVLLWPFVFSPLRRLPEPKGGHLLTGHTHLVPNERSGMPHDEWINEIPDVPLVRYRMRWNKEVVFVTSAPTLAEVLVQKNYEFSKPASLRRGLGRILGVGLIVAEGQEHKTQRKLLMPAFSHRHVKNLYPVFWEQACRLVEVLEEETGKTGQATLDITDWLARATLDILGVAGLGEAFDTLHHPDHEICTAYRGVFEQRRPAGRIALLLMMARHVLSPVLPQRDPISVATETLTGVARRLIANKTRQTGASASGGKDIISVALSSGQFTDRMLENHLLTFLAAGHETTATTLTWAVYALCLYPKVQERLREELRQSLPMQDSAVTAESLDTLPYLQAVCNEVLRVYPPAGLTRRIAVRDTLVQGQFIPAGTELAIVLRATNLSTRLWGADAREFRPERWLKTPSGGGSTSNYAFMTFLHGPRSCIGQGFARGEFACLLAALVRAFTIELAEDGPIVIETGLTSRPRGGLKVRLTHV